VPSFRATGFVSLACVGVLVATSHVEAQCDPPPLAPIEVTPATGATGVTTDSWVMVRFTPGYFGPEGPGDDPRTLITLRRCGECGSRCGGASPVVTGRVEVLGDDLFFVPDQPFDQQTQYAGQASGLGGVLPISFCTGNRVDDGPPRLGPSIRYDSVEVGSNCELPEGGYRIGVYTEPATDDGPGGSIEYLLFLTRAEGLEAPVLVDRVRNFSAGEITLRLFLPRGRAATPVCLRVGALDGVGNLVMSDAEGCFDPVSKVTFQGCAVSTLGASLRPRGVLLGLALVLLAVSARARRSLRARR
jgi:hypothetical protein